MEAINDIGAVEFFGVQTLTFSVYQTWLARSDLAGGGAAGDGAAPGRFRADRDGAGGAGPTALCNFRSPPPAAGLSTVRVGARC
jgi:hypothetical protein